MTAPTPTTDRRWVLMAFVAVAQLMVVLDATVVNIALPRAQADLGFGDAARQWVVTAYALAFGSLLLLGGRLADRIGRKESFVIGLAGFAAASALGGAATSFGMLVAARALQGIFGALLAPSVLSTLVTTFTDPKERRKAFGIFGTVAVSGGAVGLILGGLLTEYASWRWCMYVNVAFAAVAISGVVAVMPRTRSEHRPHIDLVGTVLASAGLFALVFGFSRAETEGWSAPSSWLSLAAAVVLLASFLQSQRMLATPLLPLRIPVNRTRGAAYAAVLLAMMAVFGLFLFLTYYLQVVKGYSPVRSSLAFLPMVGCIVLMSNVASLVLLPRIGPRRLIPLGMLSGAVGMTWLSTIEPGSAYAVHVLPAIMLIGLGMGSIVAPAMNTATTDVAPADAGIASALVNTSQQVGGSIGTAVLSTIAASATAGYAGGPFAAATHGYSVAFAVSAGIYVLGAIVVFAVLPRRAAKPVVVETLRPAAENEKTDSDAIAERV
ncbi:MFS transporter [Jatrophihabitans fulvus]